MLMINWLQINSMYIGPNYYQYPAPKLLDLLAESVITITVKRS